jgi:hypothetical protein
MANRLGRVKQYKTHLDLVILNTARRKRGEIRIKPNRILWARANEKGWRGVYLREFEKFMKKKGERQTK